MKKLFFVVLVLGSSLILRAAETQAQGTGDHAAPQTQVVQQTAQVAVQDKSGKLFEYISACLAERPSSNTEELIRNFAK